MARRDGFEPWAGDWLGTLRSANTRSAYERDLAVFRTWVASEGIRPRAVTEQDVEDFAERCTADGAADSTVRRRVAAVSSFYRHVGAAWAIENPAAGADRPPLGAAPMAVTLDAADAATFWRAATALGPKTATVVGLVLLDGLKAHELLRLDVADVHTIGRRVVVRLHGAAGADRVLDRRTVAALHRYLDGRRTGPLLYGDSPTRRRERLTRHGVDYLVRRTAERAGLDTPVTVNVLRNTHAARHR